MSRFCIVLLSILLAIPAAAQLIEHESELDEASFQKLPLPVEIFRLGDEDFARVAERIQNGTASMQERRWFYRAAERYAPFTATPPSDWKLKSVNNGKKIAATGPIYRWSSIGPNGDYDTTRQWGPAGAKTQGRGTALWTHMNGSRAVNKNVIFLGTADGGLWKTVDGGKTWKPLTDQQPTLSVGSVDVLPGTDVTNYNDATIYLATGEGNFSVSDKDGVGVLKSTDGGANWTVQPIPFSTDALGPGLHRIRRIRIDRNVAGGQSVWVAGDGGVYHTANGGTTWSLVTALPYSGAPATAAYPGGCWNEYATDFAVIPPAAAGGTSTLIAVFGRYANASCAANAADARKNNGVYRSTDGGATWQRISVSGFPAVPGNVGRIAILSAPSNPKHLYALVAKANNDAANNYESLGIWDTLDATAPSVTWTAESTTNYASSQGWYDLTGAVDPNNENRLMVGGLDNYISNDRAKTITAVSGWSAGDTTWAHADHHHAIWVDASTYLDANDGGINVGTISGDTVVWSHANVGGLATLQFYGIGQSATNPYKINGGLQDNGHALLDTTKWIATYGGDGGYAAVDQDNDNNAYEEYVYGAIRKSDDGGNTWPTQGCMQAYGACTGCLGQCTPDLHAAFITNFMLDVHNQNVMYVGTNYLYRNSSARTAGKVWERISTQALPTGDFVGGSTAATAYISIIHTPKAAPVGGLVTPVTQTLYVGTSTGRIWKTTDGGTTWTDLTKAPLPVLSATAGRFVSWIDTDPANANNVVVTYSGWNGSTPYPGHVFRSTDGGATWTDISGALPDEPFNSVAVNPNANENNEIYVASDSGVYVNTNGWTGNTWLRINSGLLPNVSVNMLQFTNATTPKRLRAATHGRGIWEMEKGAGAMVTLDRSNYDCSDSATIAVTDNNRGAGSVTVTVASAAESEDVVLPETPAGSGHFVKTIRVTGSAATAGDGQITVLNADTINVTYRRKVAGPSYANTYRASATTNCDACGGSAAAGANLRIEPGSVALSVEGGDHDEFLDNCETGRVDFVVKNDGAGSLTNLRIVRVTASNASIRTGTMPVAIAASLPSCGTAAAAYRFTAAGLTPRETLTLTIDVTSDELASLGITRTVTATFSDTEQDWVLRPSKTWSFESGMDGWQVVQGTFARTTTGGGANLTSTYLASSSVVDSACDEVRSPIVKVSPTSTLTVYNQFAIEPISDAWYDRGNLAVYDLASGTRSTVAPSGGRTYLASGPNGVCVVAGQAGWAGPGPGWLPSSWTPADLGAAAIAGRRIQLDIGYGTDATASGVGLWIDEVTLTNFYEQSADQQSNGCP